MWLIIDDYCECGCAIIARTAEAGKAVLAALGKQLEGVMFDHDLGDGETGYDLIKWAIENKHLPKKVQLVTANPAGRQNMANALLYANYIKSGANYIRAKKQAGQ